MAHTTKYPIGEFETVLASTTDGPKRLIGCLTVKDGEWSYGFRVDHGSKKIECTGLSHAIRIYNEIEE